MSMSKQDFIALADAIREHNVLCKNTVFPNIVLPFNDSQLNTLAKFCKGQNPAFKKDRWLGYINGENGSNGGKIPKQR